MNKLVTKLQIVPRSTMDIMYQVILFLTWRMPTWEALVTFFDDTLFSMANDISGDIIVILESKYRI